MTYIQKKQKLICDMYSVSSVKSIYNLKKRWKVNDKKLGKMGERYVQEESTRKHVQVCTGKVKVRTKGGGEIYTLEAEELK